MKNYTSLNQLILEAEEDVKFKLEGRPEDNLLNGLVPKRFAYSYTYPKNSTSIFFCLATTVPKLFINSKISNRLRFTIAIQNHP